MTTSDKNPIRPLANVTPDCIIQATADFGYIGETKLSLPRNHDNWDADIQQLQKYDDDLAGWWTSTERIANHDLIALVPLSRAVSFGDHLDQGIRAAKWKFSRHLAVVGFIKETKARQFLRLKREWGDLTDPDLNERLRKSDAVPLSLLIRTGKQFIDSKPPLAWLLQVIWDQIFTVYAAASKKRSEQGDTEITITTEKLTTDLQTYFGYRSAGPRSPEIPKMGWVREALDALVKFKLAKANGKGKYVVQYKRTRTDTLKKFGRLCHKHLTKSPVDPNCPFLPGLGP